MYNCEDFAREIMTGFPECQQRDRVIETSNIIVEVAGQMLLKMAEMQQQMQAAQEEAKRRQAAAVTATAQVQSPPAPLAPVAQQPAPIVPPQELTSKGARKPVVKKPKARRKPPKTRR
jgi:hypothetical protein